MEQTWVVALLVLMASAYSIWYCLPAAWRRRFGRNKNAQTKTGVCTACHDCRGCASVTPPLPAGDPRPEQPIRLYARK